jgi:hypothetical protein
MLIEYAVYKVEEVWTNIEKVSFAMLFMALGWVLGSSWGIVMPLLSQVFYSGPEFWAP